MWPREMVTRHGILGDWIIAPPLAAAGVDLAWCERAPDRDRRYDSAWVGAARRVGVQSWPRTPGAGLSPLR